MPLYPELKVVGWTSGYPSVQKFLNYVKKDKKLASSEKTVDLSLFSIALLCEAAKQNPDEVIASLKSHRVDAGYYFNLGRESLRQSGMDEKDIKFWEACFTMFMLENNV